MKFREFFENIAAMDQRYQNLVARRRQGLPFASSDDRTFFQNYAQGQHNAAQQTLMPPPSQPAKYQPTKLPEEEERADFERLQAMSRSRLPMSPEDRARLMKYYQQKAAADKLYDRQQGWGL